MQLAPFHHPRYVREKKKGRGREVKDRVALRRAGLTHHNDEWTPVFLSSLSIQKLEIIQRPSEYFRDSALLYARAPKAYKRMHCNGEVDEEYLGSARER